MMGYDGRVYSCWRKPTCGVISFRCCLRWWFRYGDRNIHETVFASKYVFEVGKFGNETVSGQSPCSFKC